MLMFLIDTNVISESRKGDKANSGVQAFFRNIIDNEIPIFISVVTIGELRRGIEKIRYRGDNKQAAILEKWLNNVLNNYCDDLLEFDEQAAQVWGKLRVPHHENALDKQIAATALIHDLTVATQNIDDFSGSGVNLVNPFTKK